MDQKITYDIKEIYKMLCPQCRDKLKEMVKEKLTDRLVEKALEDKQL
jgi:hypothetical protein